ncbi:polyprenyl synthetase family protein [Paracoccus sp. MBLB3053]|uniref:Polyprenyl synthetase family protein n=1 Tax=Paracoccus aurantius TaxID=3073814 RepID=A0ABU2HUP2_9RHOB|nr:polyprenyl synthetase family protein [Paracoccus sp. MBLB3053]MDS9468762.1 polyprenyl synthetase family protein [Paracoccus sp. MBLB3053]
MGDEKSSSDWRCVVDTRLAEIAKDFRHASPPLGQAMTEAVLAPGKRFRALTLLIAGQATGGVGPALIDAGCAIELVHTASLVFDDLPCMDDAQLRRGRPTTHRLHGESRAILAGIALVTEAMRLLATTGTADGATRARLIEILAEAVGPAGLCAGQDLDLHAQKDLPGVEREQDLKTGALFEAGFEMLGVIQRLDGSDMDVLRALGRTLGRAFQSYDDLLDVCAEEGDVGKDIRRDAHGTLGARGILAVSSQSQAEEHYQTLRAELDRLVNSCGFDSYLLARHIGGVLPLRGSRAA